MLLSTTAALPLRQILQDAGLRPTRQRIALAGLLRTAGAAHYSAESLYKLAMERNISVSLATVYNTVHQFCLAGLLRKIVVSGQKIYFDTNVTDHHHCFVENEDRIIDISPSEFGDFALPAPPTGHVLARVDVIVRLRRVNPPLPRDE